MTFLQLILQKARREPRGYSLILQCRDWQCPRLRTLSLTAGPVLFTFQVRRNWRRKRLRKWKSVFNTPVDVKIMRVFFNVWEYTVLVRRFFRPVEFPCMIMWFKKYVKQCVWLIISTGNCIVYVEYLCILFWIIFSILSEINSKHTLWTKGYWTTLTQGWKKWCQSLSPNLKNLIWRVAKGLITRVLKLTRRRNLNFMLSLHPKKYWKVQW